MKRARARAASRKPAAAFVTRPEEARFFALIAEALVELALSTCTPPEEERVCEARRA